MSTTLVQGGTRARTGVAATESSGQAPVLRVEGLEVTYYTDAGRAKALDQVSFTLHPGQKLGMVG